MHSADFAKFLAGLSVRLLAKHYASIGTAAPLQAGFFKLGALSLPYAIGIKNGMISTDSPAQIFQQTKSWFHSLIGQTGGGLLVFVYYDPPARVVNQMPTVGDGLVVAGHYDLLTGSDSIPVHLNWRNEILDK